MMFVILSLLCGNVTFAQEFETNHQTIVLVPHFSFEDIEALLEKDQEPFLWEKASIGAMNVRPDGPYQYLHNTVTMAVGDKARGVDQWNAYEQNEQIAEQSIQQHQQQTLSRENRHPITRPDIYHPYFFSLKQTNLNTSYRGQIGKLGEWLKEANVDHFVYGHSDTEQQVRYASLFIIDEKATGQGALKEAVQTNSERPYRYQMDQDFIIEHMTNRQIDNVRTYSVIEWGDFYRLDMMKDVIEPNYYLELKETLRKELTQFLLRLKDEQNQEIWLLTPMMDQTSYQQKKWLTPILNWGSDEAGFFTSATTRQSYIVSSIDLLPTWVDRLSLPHGDTMLTGKALTIEHSNRLSHERMFRDLDHITHIFKSRSHVLTIFILSLVGLLGLAGIVFVWLRNNQYALIGVKVTFLAAWSSLLYFLLLAPLSEYMSVILFLLTLMSLSILTGFVIYRLCRQPISVVAGIVFAAITVDQLFGGPLIQRSYLGFDPIIGARFYGIGNEFGGVYIIAVMAMLMPFFTNKKRDLLIVFSILASTLFILAAQIYGTNAGGTLSAAIAYVVLLLKMYRNNIHAKKLWIAGFFALIGAVAFLFIMQLIGMKSHIGLAFERLLSGDFVYIQDMIIRKLTMNYKILRHSNWTLLFASSYVVVAILIWFTRNQLVDERKRLFLQAGVVASVALLFLNDSGVVAAATSMFCVVSSYCYWVIEMFWGKHSRKGGHSISGKLDETSY